MHLAGGKDQPLPHFPLDGPQGGQKRVVADAVAGIAGQQNHRNPHLRGKARVFGGRHAAGRHLPQRAAVGSVRSIRVHRLQVDGDHPPGQAFQLPHGILRRRFRQCLQDRRLHVEHIQQQDIGAQRGGILGVCHVAQQWRRDADGLTGQHAALAAGDRSQQLPTGKTGKLAGGAVQQAFCHGINPPRHPPDKRGPAHGNKTARCRAPPAGPAAWPQWSGAYPSCFGSGRAGLPGSPP